MKYEERSTESIGASMSSIGALVVSVMVFAPIAAAGPPTSPGGPTMFQSLPVERTGIDFVNPILPDHPKNYLFPFGYACGGVSIGDLDGDGHVGGGDLGVMLADWGFCP